MERKSLRVHYDYMVRASEICGLELTNLSQNLKCTLILNKSLFCYFFFLRPPLISWWWLTLLQTRPSLPCKGPWNTNAGLSV